MGGQGKKNLYDGKAGHLAVMSELLCRGWNVAIPEVDVGDDVFAVMDAEREFIPIQVKSANAKQQLKSYSARFEIPMDQLEEIKTPALVYVLAVRVNNLWKSFIVIPQYELLTLATDQNNPIGYKSNGNLYLY